MNRKVYAKGLCSNCYYKSSRMRPATSCAHAGVLPHYSKGQCRNCYLMDYYTLRKQKTGLKLAQSTQLVQTMSI